MAEENIAPSLVSDFGTISPDSSTSPPEPPSSSPATASSLAGPASLASMGVRLDESQGTHLGFQPELEVEHQRQPQRSGLQELQSPKPLVLRGSVSYTFATRTSADSEQKNSAGEAFRGVYSSGSTDTTTFLSTTVPADSEAAPYLSNAPESRNKKSCNDRSGGSEIHLDVSDTTCASNSKGKAKEGSNAASPLPTRVDEPPVQHRPEVGETGRPSHRKGNEAAWSNGDGCRSTNSSSNNSGSGSDQTQEVPPLMAPDIAVLLRDFAAFVQRIERQLNDLKCRVQQGGEEMERAQKHQQPQQQQQPEWTWALSWRGRAADGNSGQLQRTQKQQKTQSELLNQRKHQQCHQQLQEDAKSLRQSLLEGVVVCRSLHSRLSSLLQSATFTSTISVTSSSDLLLAKLRRDFAQQQQQYTRLMRLLDYHAELLQEPSSAPEPQALSAAGWCSGTASVVDVYSTGGSAGLLENSVDEAPAKILWHSSPGRSSCLIEVDMSHFCNPQRVRQDESILWAPEEDSHEGHLIRGELCRLQQNCTVNLPRLLIGTQTKGSESGRPSEGDLWEPAALVEVDEDYEKRQIIIERKEQLQQLQQVERCVFALRELQLHVAADVAKGEELLRAAEEDTEAAADHTAAGAQELAAAARGKSRWWGVQGGGAAALVGVSIGAVAGGPIGAALGAVVGAVAGVSSGAALRVRHRERINAVERSVRRRRGQVLKRPTAAARPISSPSGRTNLGVPAVKLGGGQQTTEGSRSASSGRSRTVQDVEGPSRLGPCSSDLRPKVSTGCSSSQTIKGESAKAAFRLPTRLSPGGKSTNNYLGEEQQSLGRRRDNASMIADAEGRTSRRSKEGGPAQPTNLRASLAIPGILPAVHFTPK